MPWDELPLHAPIANDSAPTRDMSSVSMTTDWKRHWTEGNTPWDAGQAAPALRSLLDAEELPKGQALVPGAGSGYDAIALARAGYEVTALDLSPVARARFQDLAADMNPHPHYEVADFFAWQPAHTYDLIWDYTFLCALPPSRRREWASRMKELVAPTGQLVTLIFPVNPGAPPDEGPPYPMTPELVRQLLLDKFEELVMQPVRHSLAPRQGKEWLARWSPRATDD